MARVAFLGLGVMGFPMAGHLVAAGHEVTVYNRTAARADAWVDRYGGAAARTPADAARGADVVAVCVGGDDDVREVVTGPDGALAAVGPGAVIVDHTTTSAELARSLHAAAAAVGVGFVDAPVSGGQSGAEQGVLTIMGGGDEDAWARVAPIVRAYARQARRIGPSGAGQLCKMVNQVCVAGAVQGLAEGIALGRAAGLDLEAVFDVITQGAAGSWQMSNRWRTMVEGRYDFGFAVDHMRKDLGFVLREAEALGVPMPLTQLVDGFYDEVSARGGGRWDTSSLLVRLLQGGVPEGGAGSSGAC